MRNLLAITIAISALACNSSNNTESSNYQSSNEDPCTLYNYQFTELQNLINNLHIEYPDYQDEEATADISQRLERLNAINCGNKKSVEFAEIAIKNRQKDIEREKQILESEVKNGDDLFITGVRIKETDITYDDDMQPIANLIIENNTTRLIRSFKIAVDFCGNKPVINCLTIMVLKQKIPSMSSAKVSLRVKNESFNGNDYPTIKLFEVLRDDGKKVLTQEGFTYDVDKNYNKLYKNM